VPALAPVSLWRGKAVWGLCWIALSAKIGAPTGICGDDALDAQDLAAMPLVLDACAFATRMHGKQQRKYTGEPYVLHCLEVARMVAQVGGTPAMIAAALLHDVVEDTEASVEDVQARFGEDIARGVDGLSRYLAPTGSIGAIACMASGAEAKPVRAILFDKSVATHCPVGAYGDGAGAS
jgi:hypothetical protein